MSNNSSKTPDGLNADVEALRSDFLALKSDIASAIGHIKTDTLNGAQNAAQILADKTAGLSADISAQGQKTIKSIGDQIERQPLASVLIAFSIGFVLSRAISR